MNRRYLEIDSTFRNRTLYSNPSNFEILFSQSGCRDSKNAYDPIALSAPIIEWCPQDIYDNKPTVYPHPSNTSTQFIVCVDTSGVVDACRQKYKKRNYYNGYPFYISGGVYALVTSSQYINTSDNKDYFRFTIDNSQQDNEYNVDITYIFDISNGFIWVPCSFNYDNEYICDYYLYNDTIQKHVKIESFDGFTHQIGITVDNITDWTDTHCYSIRKELPSVAGTLQVCQPFWSSNKIVLPDNTNITIGDYIRITSGDNKCRIFRICGYTGKGYVLTNGKSTGNKICASQDPPPYPDMCNDPNEGDYWYTYTNCAPLLCKYESNWTDIQPILSCVNDGTKITIGDTEICLPYILQVEPIFTKDADPVDIYKLEQFTDISCHRFEILRFSRDNVVPLEYSGSHISQQEMVCYEVELLNLILPNKILKCGGLPAFYPFLYVALQNVSSPGAGLRNIIYSNNPNARRMLFKVPITDTSNPLTVPFINLSSRMVQTIKFKPNDNLFFGVYLPNGEPFELDIKDNMSPLCPNSLVQISATFSIKRL